MSTLEHVFYGENGKLSLNYHQILTLSVPLDFQGMSVFNNKIPVFQECWLPRKVCSETGYQMAVVADQSSL